MGSISFLLPKSLPGAAAATLPDACIASSVGYYDQTPGPTTLQIANGSLVLSREESGSGYLVLPWPVEPFGTLVVSTTTLREREEPYRLLVELARGKLNQVRVQTGEWQGIGLRTTPEFDRALSEATRLFGVAALAGNEQEADASATRVLEKTHELADRLARDYIEQMFATRHDEGPLDTWLTARHQRALSGDAAKEYTTAFNAANVYFRWRDVEPHEAQYDWTQADAAVSAALDAGFPVTIGPIIDLAPGMLPAWAAGWHADLPALAAFMCDYLETAVSRYKNEVRRWIICAGFNNADALGLVDDDRLRLAYRLFEAAAQVDPSLELILSVAQPWGDYLASADQTISPMTFPDDLVRAGVRLAAVELELRIGTRPRGSLPRDLLDTARLLDNFGMLGPPLEVSLGLPTASEPDRNATEHEQEVWKHGWRSGPSVEGQAEWGASFAALALCWPKVRTVTWDHWSDAEPHLVPNGGLLDENGRPRPLLSRLRTLRNEHLDPPR
jgi:GH35 family endo-1,4-beta-xylanase